MKQIDNITLGKVRGGLSIYQKIELSVQISDFIGNTFPDAASKDAFLNKLKNGTGEAHAFIVDKLVMLSEDSTINPPVNDRRRGMDQVVFTIS